MNYYILAELFNSKFALNSLALGPCNYFEPSFKLNANKLDIIIKHTTSLGYQVCEFNYGNHNYTSRYNSWLSIEYYHV